MRLHPRHLVAFVALTGLALLGCGCGSGSETTAEKGGGADGSGGKVSGAINIDGSSTVFPVAEQISDEFKQANSGVQISASQAGTGAGFTKFIAKEVDICDASRVVTADEDAKLKAAGIDYIEVPIAFDGLSVVVNPKNTWLTSITTAELKKAWDADSTVKQWSDLRAGFPAKPITFYGPDTSHGTFDYFTETINGKKGQQRKDYQKQTEYNALVQGVASDEGALGYVGYSYYVQNKDKIKAIPVDGGKGPVAPSDETILNGSYAPLSRPLFMYVAKSAYDSKPQIKAFIDYVLNKGIGAIKDSGYVPLPDSAYAMVKDRVKAETTGSAFMNAKPGSKIEDVLGKK
jgi:phosphate transport system substrate-binding protein